MHGGLAWASFVMSIVHACLFLQNGMEQGICLSNFVRIYVFCDCCKAYSKAKTTSAEPVDDNIYYWNVKMFVCLFLFLFMYVSTSGIHLR